MSEFELPVRVYRIDAVSGAPSIVADDFVRPNGLAFSPDEKILYIVDSGITHGGPAHIRAFNVDGGGLSNGRIFAEDFAPGLTDGIRVDVDGNVWASMGWGDPLEDGVRCYLPSGELVGKIHLPEGCANLCFGGKKRNRLFMTAGTSVYALYVNARGVGRP
jgi:gluconolactonase